MKIFNPKPSELGDVLCKLEQNSGYSFQNREVLLQALHHSSYASEQQPPIQSNERLEFLGDAVLELIASRELFTNCPDIQEGQLTQVRSLLVDEKANCANCRAIGLDQALFLGHGEELTGGRDRQSLLGDAFEAFLGAVYLDGGYDAAAGVMHRLWRQRGGVMTDFPVASNPKGTLQEYCQAMQGRLRPVYTQLGVSGPIHAPCFDYEVSVAGITLGHGSGASKKTAENAAAADALDHWEELKSRLEAAAQTK